MSLTRDDGIERSRRREYDRKGDWYEETVPNEDGSERYHVAEPLSKQSGPRLRQAAAVDAVGLRHPATRRPDYRRSTRSSSSSAVIGRPVRSGHSTSAPG